MKLFTNIADLSNRTGKLAHLADSLLSRVAPQQPAAADRCTSWIYGGCCGTTQTRYTRSCFDGDKWYSQYYCSGACRL